MGPRVPAHSWTLMGLALAFLDLALAYALLCVSAVGFFCSTFFSFFGFFIPCPCVGVLGFVDSRFCLRKLLIEIPLRNIVAVHVLIKSRFPFSAIYYDEQEDKFNLKDDRNRGSEYGFLDLGGEVCSGSGQGLILRGLRDRRAGDVKGKGLLSQKQQRSARRRRRVILGNGNHSHQLKTLGSSIVTERLSVCGGNEVVRSEIGESLIPLSGTEENFRGDENNPFGTNAVEKSWHSFDLSESFEVGNSGCIDSSCAENFIQETQEAAIDGANKIKTLEKTLEEVKAAYNALLLELEKERAAAATAADEAMAMILRVQNEKASIEMEVRQNQRMVEEKFSYDEEEMNILKEILVRREMENFVLENEIAAFKQMMSSSSDKNLEECSQDADIRLMVPQVENGGMNREKAAVRSNNLLSYRFSSEEVSQSEIHEPDTSISPEIPETNDEKCKCLSCDHEELKYGEHRDYEVPQVVYDVHVIDDMNEQPAKKTDKESSVGDIPSDVQLVGRRGSLGSTVHDTGRSLSTVDSERLRLDSEVEWLREMLRKVQEEKEKLKLAAENRDKGRIELKLLNEIRDQIQEIQKLRQPLRHASLPPLCKVEDFTY